MYIGDAIKLKPCKSKANCCCPFCTGYMTSDIGLVIESWTDIDDNPSAIVAFEGDEVVLRKDSQMSWMSFSSYEIINR